MRETRGAPPKLGAATDSAAERAAADSEGARVPSRLLTDLTWPDVRDALQRGSGIILPVGATEQHGYHLPLSTDTLVATDLAVTIAGRLDYLVAPPVNYGYRSRPLSGGGPGFPGTISLSANALVSVVTDILSELIRHGFKRLVVLSMHLENQNMLYESACLAFRGHEDADVRIMVVEQPFAPLSQTVIDTLFPDGFPGWEVEHAAVLETSLMLSLHPELVRLERAVDDGAKRRASYEMLPVPDDLITASGTLWRATQGTAAKGHAAWEEMLVCLEDAIRLEMSCQAPAVSVLPGSAIEASVESSVSHQSV
jgi:creatinine amidohydrolase